ncbi:MAG TPA: gamma-glutamyl-gamma-aminobutyrate hydrolase family protein [Candidatus Acidoferrales bacterium]
MSTLGARPKIGIPFRSTADEQAGRRDDRSIRAIEEAGGEAVVLSLATPQKQLAEIAAQLDAFVLPGSPADVDPAWYHTARHPQCHDADPAREQADFTILDVALTAGKPVLGICYGMQSLNVYLGGNLHQDIPTELETSIQHHWSDRAAGAPEPFHLIALEPGSLVARLAGGAEARVNSSHHQSVRRVGRDLRIAATAPDGVIEAIERTGEGAWIAGVEWHPERMTGPEASGLGDDLFRALVNAALGVNTARVQ